MLNKKQVNYYNFLPHFILVLLLFGCAAQQPPQGGPRDLTPPKLVKAVPANKTRNFAAKEIDLEFDEFIKLTNQYQEISMSPAMEKAPEYNSNKKNLQIKFKDTLQKNTTYVINFGKSIQDVNESNVMKNFTYVFSTGPHIDSLSMSGTVTNSVTQEKEKEVTVFLFPLKQDTLFGKKKPSIYTTTDSSGNFSLNNLHENDYRIYALKEASPNKIFDNDQELIAFLKKPIHLTSDTSKMELNLFKQLPEKFRLTEKRFDTDGKMVFVFNKALDHPAVKVLYPADIDKQKSVEFSKTKDTASVYLRNMSFDSVRVAIYDNNKPIDTVSLLKGKKETFQRILTFQYNLNSNNLLKPGNELKMTASLPIENFDNSQVTLNEDSVAVAVSDYTIQKDTGDFKKLALRYRWRQGSKYEIILNEGAFTSIYGDKNKRLARRFQVDKTENYSSLTLKVTIPDTSRAYVVELLSEQKVVLQSNSIKRNESIIYNNFITGKYRISVIYDENRNGKWDSGNVHQKRQPENIWVSPNIISLRPNWEAEESITVPKEPPTY